MTDMSTEQKPSKKPRKNSSALRKAYQEVKDRLSDPEKPKGDWNDVTAATLVGLYAFTHELVYKVFPNELAADWYPALSSARKLLEQGFEGNGEKAVNFIRWTWQREKRKLEKQKDNRGDFRITWRYQFGQRLLTDYKVATQL